MACLLCTTLRSNGLFLCTTVKSDGLSVMYKSEVTKAR